jgi:hypothetical protein
MRKVPTPSGPYPFQLYFEDLDEIDDALAFFDCATPGFGSWVTYRDYWHKIDGLNLANMWTAGSTPRADLDQADWIADGDSNNLIGGRLFLGAQPVHRGPHQELCGILASLLRPWLRDGRYGKIVDGASNQETGHYQRDDLFFKNPQWRGDRDRLLRTHAEVLELLLAIEYLF